jgi:integrase
MNIKNKIAENKPDISESSIKTYNSILTNLYQQIFVSDDYDMDNFNKTKTILNYLSDRNPKQRKTILAALVVLTDNKIYRDQMLADIESSKIEDHQQKKNEKQNNNFIDGDSIGKIYNNLKKRALFLYRKGDLSYHEKQEIQNYIILSLYSGLFIPPRRAKDYIEFKIKNINKDEDNYIEKNEFVFNKYKTSKTYSQQRVTIPKPLKTILNKWIKINDTDYLLYDIHAKKLSNVTLNQRIEKMMGSKMGVNGFRHTYMSEKYQPSIKNDEDMKEDFKAMGSSIYQKDIYIQKN